MSAKSSNLIRIDEKPEPINIEPLKTALLVIEMQNDFGTKGGMFDRAGLDISMTQATVQLTSKVLVQRFLTIILWRAPCLAPSIRLPYSSPLPSRSLSRCTYPYPISPSVFQSRP